MRVLRIGKPSSVVGQDVHAALVSWGHGTSVLGGVALIGCKPPGCPTPVDAIVVLPRGVLVVVGVDLPDPARELQAPVNGPWIADGWPLEHGDGALNPGTEALHTASAAVHALQDALGTPLAACAVVAVGPYVGKVVQPSHDPARGIRVIYPEPATMREVANFVHGEVFHLDKVRGVLRKFEPDLPLLSTAIMHEEGFADAVTRDQAMAATSLMPAVREPVSDRAASAPRRGGRTAQVAGGTFANLKQAATRGGRRKWLPFAVAVAVVAVVVIVVVLLSTAGGSSAATGAQPQGPPITVDGARFERHGTDAAPTCPPNTYGDVRAWLEANPCTGMNRGLYGASKSGEQLGVSVAAVRFADPAKAKAFRAKVDEPGGGGISQLSAARWPDGPKSFDSAVFRSSLQGNEVRVAMVVDVTGATDTTDPGLGSVAKKALRVPLA